MNISIYIADEKLVKTLKGIAGQKKRSLSYTVSEILTEYLEWYDSPHKKAKKEMSKKDNIKETFDRR